MRAVHVFTSDPRNSESDIDANDLAKALFGIARQPGEKLLIMGFSKGKPVVATLIPSRSVSSLAADIRSISTGRKLIRASLTHRS